MRRSLLPVRLASQITIMTNKQYNLISFRTQDVFTYTERERIMTLASDVMTQDFMGNDKQPVKRMDASDRCDLIDAIIAAENYHHASRVLVNPLMDQNEKLEKEKVLKIVSQYGY